MKKPNFWLYLAGELAFGALMVIGGWLGVKYDNAGAFFITGAASVFMSNVSYEYQMKKLEFWRTVRDQEVQS